MQEALLPPDHPDRLDSAFGPKPLGFGDRRLSSPNGDSLFYGCYSPFTPSPRPSPRATSLSHWSSSSPGSLVDDGDDAAATEHRLHLARLALQYQDAANRYELCLCHLADAVDEAATLRVANNGLASRIAMLGGKQSSAIALADDLRRLRLAEVHTVPAPPTPALPAPEARPVSLAEKHAVLPKSIAIRSTGYLKMTQSGGKHRVPKPVNVGSSNQEHTTGQASAGGGEAASSGVNVVSQRVFVGILSRLSCHAERVRMSLLNKHWHRVFKEHSCRLPRQLPWLVLPSTTQPLFHDTLGRETHSLPLPPDVKEHGKFCGSFEGGWFVLALHEHSVHQLFNINNTTRRIDLPSMILAGDDVLPVKVVAAVLSGPPVPPYTIGAIVNTKFRKEWLPSIAYWKPSMQYWMHVVSPMDIKANPLAIQDVVYHRGAFFFLTVDENIYEVEQDGRFTLIEVKQRPDYGANVDMMSEDEDEDEDEEEKGNIRRYLMESRNDLLMVIKHDYLCTPSSPTWLIRVFMLKSKPIDYGDSKDIDYGDFNFHCDFSWKNLMFQLPGRIVFAGCACSRVLEIEDFDGFEDHSKIFFLDDRCIQTPGGYLCEDMGKFSLRNLIVERWPPAGGKEIPPLSDAFPPTWWLH